MPDQIPERVKTQRAAKLINIGRESAKSFAQNWIGLTLDVLAETRVAVGNDEKTSCAKMLSCEGAMVLKGFSDNYIEVHFLGRSGVTGKIVPVRILDVDDLGRAIGEMEKICS
jgi:tRNA A37 methylthiotransferase MiaB